MAQNQIVELERQLADAQATILALTSSSAGSMRRHFGLLYSHSRDIILFIRRHDGHIMDANAAPLLNATGAKFQPAANQEKGPVLSLPCHPMQEWWKE